MERAASAGFAAGPRQAAIAKMKLRDLAEDLPGKWTKIEEVAEEASAVFAELDGARRELAAMNKLR
ncbi:CCE_0567 family metalloprotein [Mesorhizobium sp. M1136]|uniref:CCE_0567 family metalloprotein n=1 Tax=Mesorhizobium sp. M1136 TaxID=2957059 RepID=UPI00333AA3B1